MDQSDPTDILTDLDQNPTESSHIVVNAILNVLEKHTSASADKHYSDNDSSNQMLSQIQRLMD